MPLLEVVNLVKRYGETTALNKAAFAARGGEVVALLGPNGAGKSTAFLCIAGLLRPDAGMLLWDGKPLPVPPGRTVALIPETPDVYAMLTVWEHLVFVAKSCRLTRGWEAEGERLLRKFELWEQRSVLGSALSKGMRQKLLVAATVLAGAPVMLFDEPMIGLDPLGQHELRSIIADLRARGIAILISTHQLDQAQAICDRVVIMNKGRAVASGTFEELRTLTGIQADPEAIFLELTR